MAPYLVAYDLTELRKKLPNEPEWMNVRMAIGGFESATSIGRDLSEAEQALEVLVGEDVMGKPALRDAIGSALMAQAIMLYYKATTRSHGRLDIGITDGFTKEQKQAHRNIKGLRDSVLAHYDVGKEKYGPLWRKDMAVLKASLQGVEPVAMCSRVNFLVEVILELMHLCETAQKTVQEKVHLYSGQLINSLNECNEEAMQMLLQKVLFEPGAHGFDVEKFWNGYRGNEEQFTPKLVVDGQVVSIGMQEITPLQSRK